MSSAVKSALRGWITEGEMKEKKSYTTEPSAASAAEVMSTAPLGVSEPGVSTENSRGMLLRRGAGG